MSILQLIQWRLHEGRIHELDPMPRSARRLRKMYLETQLYNELMASKSALEETKRFAQLEADLAVFVHSPTIDWKYLFGLWPPSEGVWEIRSVRPRPSIRVMGLFADRDVFVATHFVKRESLGAWNSRQWRDERLRAKTVWSQLFDPYPPSLEKDVQKLVSGAIDGKYFRDAPVK